jgi:aryl-alcohol dehydrogenase-like predicted oxidoreductase
MRYRYFSPLGKELSQLVLGTSWLSLAEIEVCFGLLDTFVRYGGNVIDSAATYGVFAGGERGDSERVLGHWFESRPGLRERVVLVSKGGHPSPDRTRVTPEDLSFDLDASLTRLGTERIDIYMLHRDDPGVPVGPLVDALDAHKRAGRIGCVGVSNWTTERIDEALSHASERGIEPFACSSCNLSLAVQREPMWPGSLSAADAASRRWYKARQMPLFAWSAQAGGFFILDSQTIRADPDLNRVYGSAGNWERKSRAEALAQATGRTANQLALAWVLGQPFPTWAIVGPRVPAELDDSVAALDLELTPQQTSWLNLETDEAPDAVGLLQSAI